MYRRDLPIHFVGVGGIGMSGIAEVLLTLGYPVSGSDIADTEITRRLTRLGGRIFQGHDAAHVAHDTPPAVVVVSSAVKPDNPEVVAARTMNIPVIPRAAMLAELMRLSKWGVAVAGTHGKTTTSSLIAAVLAHAGLDPTAVIGGRVNSFGSTATLGQGDFLIAEADESDGSFLQLVPSIAVVTNIDREHLEHYGNFDALKDAFVTFMNSVPFYGLDIVCLDHPVVRELLPRVDRRHVTYGFSAQADYRAVNLEHKGWMTHFDVLVKDNPRPGPVRLNMPGAHNVLNALAALALAEELSIAWESAAEALATFAGIGRRCEVVGRAPKDDGEVTVVDDYGHHPAEITATLKALRNAAHLPDGETSGEHALTPGRLLVVFQPHRYTRTHDLADEFMQAFDAADFLVVTDIYAAGEDPIPGVTGEFLAQRIRDGGHKHVAYVGDMEQAIRHAADICRGGDIIVGLGAGNISRGAHELLEILQHSTNDENAQPLRGSAA